MVRILQQTILVEKKVSDPPPPPCWAPFSGLAQCSARHFAFLPPPPPPKQTPWRRPCLGLYAIFSGEINSKFSSQSFIKTNNSCRCITGCLRPTNVDSLYVLAVIAPPGVRRSVVSRTERRRQADDTRHPCHYHQPAPSCLKSRKSFLHAVQPLSQHPQAARLALWEEQRIAKQHLAKLPIPTSVQLAPGHKSEWKLWKSLNGLRTGMGSKTNLSKWGYADTADTACECGTSEQTMQHLLRCPLLENECSLEDLATANEKALHCARAWPNIWLISLGMMDTKEDQK